MVEQLSTASMMDGWDGWTDGGIGPTIPRRGFIIKRSIDLKPLGWGRSRLVFLRLKSGDVLGVANYS